MVSNVILDFNLLENKAKTKPILTLGFGLNNNFQALIDTGAMLPVWCDDITILSQLFNIKEANFKTAIQGFGKGISLAPVYIIEKFKMTDNKGNFVVYHNLPVAYYPRDYGFAMVLSYTMFTKTNVSFLTYASSSKKDIMPHVIMHYKRSDIYANAIVKNNIMTKISVFLQ